MRNAQLDVRLSVEGERRQRPIVAGPRERGPPDGFGVRQTTVAQTGKRPAELQPETGHEAELGTEQG